MKTERAYLIIRADRSLRVVRRMHALRADEVAIAVDLRFPSTWGRTLPGVITVDVPENTPTVTATGLTAPTPRPTPRLVAP